MESEFSSMPDKLALLLVDLAMNFGTDEFLKFCKF